MATVTALKEGARGCGYRQPGGLYLRSDGIHTSCGIMPIPLDVCPTCHGGIKPSRGWTWINLKALTAPRECSMEPKLGEHMNYYPCRTCPARFIERCGLLWIGDKFYSPREWLKESNELGVSRRISAVPKDFKLGETWVAVAHRKAIESAFVFGSEPTYTPAIFHFFKPQRIEYVVRGNESEKTLDSMEKRGLTLVSIEKI